MDVRPAEYADRPAIRDVARRSLQASYSLEPRAITTAIEEWYDEDRLAQTLEGEDRAVLVAEWDGQVVAFTESVLTGDETGTVLWIHVDPAHRGRGIGTDLFEATRDHLAERGATRLQGRVLADNAVGNAFYHEHGFEEAGQQEVEIAGHAYVENRYVESDSGREAIPVGDRTVYVDHDVTEDGSVAPFKVVYADDDAERRFGYYCSNCQTVANAMDAMGRIECDDCGNARKPTRWDASYL